MFSDLRYALRSLRKTPGFTLIAVLTLALGIGATTAVFSLVDAVILRPLALPRPEALLAVRCILPAVERTYPTLPVNARFYTEWKACPAFAELAVIDRGRVTLTGAGEPLRLATVRSSSNLFATLGVVPALGRAFSADETDPAKSPVAVISDRLWRERFSADPAVIGRAVTLNLKPVTVIGVLPPAFSLPGLGAVSAPDVYLLRTFGADELAEAVGMFNYEVIGRLAAGATREDAMAQMNVVAARLTQLDPDKTVVRGAVTPLQEAVIGEARRPLWLLLAAIAAVLALACLNLGILGLARAERRGRDAAVRAALGASRARLLSHSGAESLLLGLAGGALGLLFAEWLLDALVGLAPLGLPRIAEARLDAPAFLFALGAALLATLASGFVPAWHLTRADGSSALLGDGSTRTTSGRGARRLRAAFIGIEIAVSTVLLVTAALLTSSFLRVQAADTGVHAPAVLMTSVNIPGARYRDDRALAGYYHRVLDAVAAVPGVLSAGVTNLLPLKGQTWIDGVHVEGDARPSFRQPQANVRFVSAGYFQTLGIPVVAGRTFRDDDAADAVVISNRLAATLWPGQDALGRLILRGDGDAANRFRVVGIVGDTRTDLDQQPVSILYRTLEAWPMNELSLAVRLDSVSTAGAAAVRRAIVGVDSDVPVQPFQTMGSLYDSALAGRRFQLQLVVAFGLAALTLAVLGIIGVVSHNVSQRTRELGIRLALGARPAALLHMIVRQTLRPVGLGLAAGLAGALASGKLLAGLLYDTSPRDPLTLAVVAALLLLSAFLACWLPARRAARTDPSVVLRAE